MRKHTALLLLEIRAVETDPAANHQVVVKVLCVNCPYQSGSQARHRRRLERRSMAGDVIPFVVGKTTGSYRAVQSRIQPVVLWALPSAPCRRS